jgi:hypothetical protein
MNETMKSNMETAQKFFELCNIMSNDRSLADHFNLKLKVKEEE